MAILLISLIFQIALSFKKSSFGLMAYLAIRLCIPNAARVGSLSFNTIALITLIICTMPTLVKQYYYIDKNDKYYIRKILYLIGILYILTFFADYVPHIYQTKALIQMFGTELLPSLLFIILIKDQLDLKKCVMVIALCSIFTSLYGIFTFITRSNPLFELFDTEGNMLENETSRAGIESMAVGIYNDSIYMSLICLLLIIFLYNKASLIRNNYLWLFSISVLTINLILTTKRSGLLALFVFGIILFLDQRYRKNIKKILIVGIIGLFLISLLPQGEGIKNIFISIMFFWDDKVQNSLDMGGSTNDLRLMQLLSVLNLVKSNLLQGMGYNFPNYYYTEIHDASIYGLDPEFAGFESFIFRVLSSSGIIGLIIWLRTFYATRKYISYQKHTFKFYTIAFVTSYLVAILMTDTSGSIFLFFILTVINRKFVFYAKDSSKLLTAK